MQTLELQKIANEVRKESLPVYIVQKPDIQADLYLQQTFLPISILKR